MNFFHAFHSNGMLVLLTRKEINFPAQCQTQLSLSTRVSFVSGEGEKLSLRSMLGCGPPTPHSSASVIFLFFSLAMMNRLVKHFWQKGTRRYNTKATQQMSILKQRASSQEPVLSTLSPVQRKGRKVLTNTYTISGLRNFEQTSINQKHII